MASQNRKMMRRCEVPVRRHNIAPRIDKFYQTKFVFASAILKGHSQENDFDIITLNDRLGPNANTF
jgi:hypothetical protein